MLDDEQQWVLARIEQLEGRIDVHARQARHAIADPRFVSVYVVNILTTSVNGVRGLRSRQLSLSYVPCPFGDAPVAGVRACLRTVGA